MMITKIYLARSVTPCEYFVRVDDWVVPKSGPIIGRLAVELSRKISIFAFTIIL